MNVFGKNERSWRKARKRGVSPIIATILLVAITVVLAAVLYVLISGLTGGGVGSKPIGTAFNAGNALLTSPTTAAAFTATGCLGGASTVGHWCYVLTVESSTVNFGQVLFEVKTASGTIATATAAGGFSVLNIAGTVVAQYAVGAGGGLAMSSGFTFPGGVVSTTSPLNSLYTLVVDLGLVTGAGTSPAGTGLTFVALGTGGFSGTTSPVSLP